MKLPNKLFSYKDSILSKLPIVLSKLHADEYIDVYELYRMVEHSFSDISEFIEVLDCLYALGKIKSDFYFRRIKYAI